jgi:predicted RNA-binding Zn-ribbon protein involved in translation (DUF1610 family)
VSGAVLTGAVILWVVPIFVARSQGRAKNRSGIAYGFFLGWLGVLILALLSPLPSAERRECPHCLEEMHAEATVCPHCQRDVEPVAIVRRFECPRCQESFPAGSSECPHCGAAIDRYGPPLREVRTR